MPKSFQVAKFDISVLTSRVKTGKHEVQLQDHLADETSHQHWKVTVRGFHWKTGYSIKNDIIVIKEGSRRYLAINIFQSQT